MGRQAGGLGRGSLPDDGGARTPQPLPLLCTRAGGKGLVASWGPGRVRLGTGAWEDGTAMVEGSGRACGQWAALLSQPTAPRTGQQGQVMSEPDSKPDPEPEPVPAEQAEPARDVGHEGRFQPRDPALLMPCPLVTPLGAAWPSLGSTRAEAQDKDPNMSCTCTGANLLAAQGILPVAVTAAID